MGILDEMIINHELPAVTAHRATLLKHCFMHEARCLSPALPLKTSIIGMPHARQRTDTSLTLSM